MKVVLVNREGAVVGYVGLDNLPSSAGQGIPDAVTHAGLTYTLQKRDAFPEALWNCEAVFKEAISAAPATPLYATKVDGAVLDALCELGWLVAQERSVALVDDPQTEAMVGRGEALLAATAPLHPHNAQVLQDLHVGVAEARYWMKPDPGTARGVVQARDRRHINTARSDFAQAMLHPQNEGHG